MSGITTCLSTPHPTTSAPLRQGKWFLVFLLGLLFSFPSELMGQANTTPTYTWLKQQQLPTVNVSFTGVNTEDITIAVATDPAGNVYTLSFGKGIAKRNAEGAVINSNFIPASKLDGPLDMAIDSDGLIYVANYLPEGNTFADNGQIRIFDPQGNLVNTIWTSFYRPMGLVVDEEKVYVAEFYDGVKGPEPGSVYSRIRIYNKTAGDVLDTNNQVEVPLRIAIDSQKRIYVSQAGYSNNPKLQFFDADLNFITSIAGVTTPGSIVIDKYDYIHVVDYAGRIDFSRFINFENIEFSEIQAIAKAIDEGQQANAFSIKILSPNRTLVTTLKNQIDFPLDLTFNNCDRMYVNNSKVFGRNILFFGYLPEKIEFHLEIYQRTPSFDQEKPLFTCPASIEETAPAGQNSVAVYFANPTVTDNCSFTVAQTKGKPSGSQFSVGTHTIEFTATDTAGNFGKCSFTITVNPAEQEPDTEDPVITCPQNITRNVDSGSCGAVVTYTTPTATDNSGSAIVTLKAGIASGGTFPVGTTTVIYEAVDEAGNIKECGFTVTVKDNEKPKLTCRENIEVDAQSGEDYSVVNFNNPTATDNCSFTVAQTKGDPSGSQFSVGTHTIEFTATDAAGNIEKCSFTITVNPAEQEPDTEDPVISCPSNTTRNIDPATCGAVVTYTTPTATDNSGNATVTLKEGIASGGTFPVGITTVTYEAVDEAGNKNECSFTVTIKDNEKPTIFCPAEITVTAPAGTNSVEVNYDAPSVNDRCSTITITQTGPASGSQFTVGKHIIEFTVTDAAGNIEKCSLTITVDPAPPVGSPAVFENCNDITANTSADECGAPINYPLPTASDNQGSVSVSRVSGPAPGEFFPVGTTTVVYEATGSDGITRQCSFKITIVDNQKPVFPFCPSDITETAPAGQNSAVVNYTPPNLTDNCSLPTTTRTGPASGEQFPLGTTTVTFTATDAAGNIETCSFKVTVNPSAAPDPVTINCLGDKTENFEADCRFEIPDYTNNATFTTGATVTQTPVKGTFVTANTKIELTATLDGEFDTCEFDLFLEDKILPVFSICPGSRSVTADANGNFTVPDYTNLTNVTDNCGAVSLTQFPAEGTVINQTTEIIFTATDENGNTAGCSFTLNLIQPPPPNGTCQNITVDLDDEGTAVITPEQLYDGNTDEENVSLQISKSTFTCADIGPNEVQLTVTGSNNVSSTCKAIVTVRDNTPPVAECPATNYVITYDGEKEVEVPDFSSILNPSDNCTENLTIIQDPPPGTIVTQDTWVRFMAEDEAGAQGGCAFWIILQDNRQLTISCPDDKTYTAGSNCGTVMPDFTGEVSTNIPEARITQFPEAGFPVNGTIDVRFTAVYEEQRVSCTIKFTMQDLTYPVLDCVEDQTEVVDAGEGFSLPNYGLQLGATDNCHIARFEQVPDVGTVVYENTEVTLKAEDGSGNITECSFMVFVQEENAPLEIICPGNQEAALGDNCSFEVPDYRNNAGVNSQDARIVQQPAPGTIITESTSITLTATLGEETDFCSFELTLKDTQDPVFTCFPDEDITFDPEVGYTIPDYREEANPSDNCDFEWVQTPAPGTVIFNSLMMELSATDASGNRTWCTFIIRLTEEEPDGLEITCPVNKSAPLNSNCEFLVPDYRNEATVNIPGAVVTQDPPAGTTINSSTSIRLTATSGNQTVNCDFQLTLEDVTAPTVACPPDQWENYDPATDFPLPDYRNLAVTSDACGTAQIQQSPSPGTNITQNTTVSLSVTDLSGNSITCAFTVNLTQEEVVEVTCPEDQVVQSSENCSFALPDFTNLAGVNFEAAQVTQAPAPGTLISGNTTVILTATLNGQSDSCAFDVYSVDNTAPVAKCILTGGYMLNRNGTRIITPEEINFGSSDNCGIVDMEISRSTFTTADIGQHEITLTVTDAAGNSDSCSTMIEIWPYEGTGNEFACKTSVVLELDETGNATLNPQDLYTGDSQGRTFTISKSNFDCSDVGENYVNFTYQGSIDSGTCEIKVEVQDNLAPIVQTQNITVFLNEAGRAEITPAAINHGTTDNCGTINYSLNITSFSCKDIGENQVKLTAVDASGNSASATAMVTVTGTCDEEPPPPGGNGLDDIFIYPNPTTGPFTIATPTGLRINRVEIFDFRGRFLLSKDFAEDVATYTLDISGVEQAVYVLNIQTSDGRRIRRVIKY